VKCDLECILAAQIEDTREKGEWRCGGVQVVKPAYAGWVRVRKGGGHNLTRGEGKY
jgi:hypothetical protein